MATHSPPNGIAAQRIARGWSQQELGDAIGAHWVTVSKLERGKMKLTLEWMKKIANALGVGPQQLLPSVQGAVTSIGGALEEDGIVHLRSEKEKSSLLGNLHFPMNFPTASSVNVKSSAFKPLLHPGDILYVVPAPPDSPILAEVDGALCIMETKKRHGRLGFLFKGSENGAYDLFWLGARLAHDVRPRRIYMVVVIEQAFGRKVAHRLAQPD